MADLSITIVRSGGVAGIRRQWRADAGDDWLDIVDECPWDALDDGRRHPDGFVWQIDVDGARSRHATLGDEQLVGPWLQLVDRVREKSA